MIAEALVLSLVTVAFAQPNYVESEQLINDAIQQLNDQLLSENHIPDLRAASRHYAVLLSQIGQVAEQIAENCSIDYETVYMDSLADNIAIALIEVNSVKETTESIINTTESNIKEILDLKRDLCNKAMPKNVCNQLMDVAVKGDPQRYQHEADVLLAGGEAANNFLNQPLPSVAKKYSEMRFLLDNIERLELLINSLAKLLSLQQKKEPCHI